MIAQILNIGRMPHLEEKGWARLGSIGEIPEGEIRGYELPLRRIAVANDGVRVFAFDDSCSHRGCLLSEGRLDREDTVVCPDDGSVFDLESGEPVEGPAEDPIGTYPVRTDAGWIEIALP